MAGDVLFVLLYVDNLFRNMCETRNMLCGPTIRNTSQLMDTYISCVHRTKYKKHELNS